MLLCGLLQQSQAKDTAAAVQLELPNIDGSRFVRMSDFVERPLLLNFWSSDCPPCLQEMPFLQQAAQRNPRVQFLGIAAQDAATARRFLVRQPPMPYLQLLAPQDSSGLLRRFGNAHGALPYTVLLNAQHQICQTRVGAVDAAWLDAALSACAAGR